MSIIGFTGTQSGMTPFQMETLVEILSVEKCHEFVHGDCYGSDAEAQDLAIDADVKFHSIFPPDNPAKRAWKFNSQKQLKTWEWLEVHAGRMVPEGMKIIQVRWHPPLPYMIRNQLIVDHSDMLIACPKEAEHSVRSGTWATIRMGWKKQKSLPSYKVVIIPPITR